MYEFRLLQLIANLLKLNCLKYSKILLHFSKLITQLQLIIQHCNSHKVAFVCNGSCSSKLMR